ncbi:myosin xvIII, putative, partial [Ixodes scapularis]
LCLPPIRAALRCPQPRVLTVVRQPSGDFGFSLRRSALSDGLAGDDRRRTLMFAEPSTLGSGGGGTGLLPGDRLLEVNGASVDERTREEVVEMVRSSGDRVSLKVQPLPELCEIVARVAGGGPPGATQGRHRTLSRTGSRRHRTLGVSGRLPVLKSSERIEDGDPRSRRSAKTDEEIAEERQWLQSEKVWVLFDGGYAGASLVKGDQVTPREGRVRVRLDATGELLDVDQEDVDKVRSFIVFPKHTRCSQRHTNDVSVPVSPAPRLMLLLRTVTSSGISAKVPMTALCCSLQMQRVMRLLRDCPADDLPPHVFAVAQAAHAALVSTRRDQTVLFLGRSGAGKTGAAKQVLQYLAITVLFSSPSPEKLTAASALLESFGNSRTWANANASRFSQLFSLEFDIAGQLVSASVQALMLERWRVSGLRKGEPNFHIFHYLLAGVGDSLRRVLAFLDVCFVQRVTVPFVWLQPEERSKCALMWELVQGSLLTLGVRESEAKGLWSVLGAICHLGEAGTLRVWATSTGTSGRLQFQRGDSAQRAALLLGTSVEDLHRAVFAHEALLSAGGNSRLASRTGDSDPQEPLQDFVAALYMEVFGAVVSLVNRALGSAGRSVATVQVLDCPGFQSGKLATLEDLCHNYVQERLQLLFHQHTFLAQQERYQQEKVAVEEAEEVASPQGLVSLLDRIPPQGAALRASSCDLQQTDQSCGLLQLLDDEALYPGNTDDAFLDRLLRMGPANDGREQRLIHPGPREGQFVLHHQLGSLPVTYGVQGWLRAAREGPAFRQAQPLLQESHKEQLAQLFGCSRGPLASAGSTLSLDAGASSSLRRTPSIRRAQSVAAAKRRSLPLQVKYTTDGMLEVLRRTRLHFVHCLVPSMQPLEQGTGGAADDAHFDVPLVRSQLKGAQVLDAVRLRKQGFPENLQYTEFRRRYSLLASADCTPERGDERAAVEALLHHLDMEPSSYRLGLSQIFLRAGTLSQLEAQRDERLSEEVVRLQARARGFLARRRHQQRKVQAMALCCIQRNVRRFLEIRSWPWWRLFVKIAPVLNVHRTEEQLKSTLEEVGQLRAKLEKAEKERSELRQNHDLLEAK